VSRAASRALGAGALLLLVFGVFTAGVFAIARAARPERLPRRSGLRRERSTGRDLESLFRVDPDGGVLAPGVPAAVAVLLTVATRARLPYDDLVATPLAAPRAGRFVSSRSARRGRGGFRPPFALLAGAPGGRSSRTGARTRYAEGLLLVSFSPRPETRTVRRGSRRDRRLLDLPHSRGVDEAEGLVARSPPSPSSRSRGASAPSIIVLLSCVLFRRSPGRSS